MLTPTPPSATHLASGVTDGLSPRYPGARVTERDLHLEWTGFAIAAWSLPALAFALYTVSNLAPRAVAHHRWYRDKFPDYPRERRALIPFVV